MKLPELLIGAGALVLGVVLAIGAVQFPAEVGYAGVGPNFLPGVIAAALLLCGAGLVREALTGGYREMEEPSGAATGYWPGFAWVSVAILLNAALINSLGFILSCTLCYALAVRGFKTSQGVDERGLGGWLMNACIGFAIAAPVFWMFTKLLDISLPGLTSTGWI